MWHTILFDLDGTLTDPRIGITSAFAYALRKYGIEADPDALTAVIGKLLVRPSFIVAKGGITSSDVGTKALLVKRALVKGQVRPGIPVWQTGEESRFPGLPYVIFPGNVGSEDDLRRVAETLMSEE